jgi:hypothetical protein
MYLIYDIHALAYLRYTPAADPSSPSRQPSPAHTCVQFPPSPASPSHPLRCSENLSLQNVLCPSPRGIPGIPDSVGSTFELPLSGDPFTNAAGDGLVTRIRLVGTLFVGLYTTSGETLPLGEGNGSRAGSGGVGYTTGTGESTVLPLPELVGLVRSESLASCVTVVPERTHDGPGE